MDTDVTNILWSQAPLHLHAMAPSSSVTVTLMTRVSTWTACAAPMRLASARGSIKNTQLTKLRSSPTEPVSSINNTPTPASCCSNTQKLAYRSSQVVRADLGSRAVGDSPNVHEAAQEMDALSGFGDLPVGTPGAPTQPQSPLHTCLSLPATHAEHHDVPVIWVHQQASRGSNT
ncbi:MAG: hypothetical protein FRX49_10824 [Trebouxia sp. A1-2]|nr:MAG: hypothetical protein FRX49_10824 [Trebouxia sp. A1-2]